MIFSVGKLMPVILILLLLLVPAASANGSPLSEHPSVLILTPGRCNIYIDGELACSMNVNALEVAEENGNCTLRLTPDKGEIIGLNLGKKFWVKVDVVDYAEGDAKALNDVFYSYANGGELVFAMGGPGKAFKPGTTILVESDGHNLTYDWY